MTKTIDNIQNIVVSGDFDSNGDVNVNGTLDVSGNATFSSPLDINASVDISNNLNVGDQVIVDGGITGAPGYAFTDNLDSGMYYNTLNDRVGITAGGNQFIDLNPANGRLTLTNDELVVSGASRLDGDTRVISTTSSTSPTTGALEVGGGVGIAENLYVGGNGDITGTLDVDGDVNLNSTTGSTSKTTGALVVDGGVGIAEDLYADNIYMPDGIRQAPNYSFTTAKDTGMYYSGGRLGLGIAEETFIDMNISTGRVSIAKDELFVSDRLRVEGIANFNDTTSSTSPTTGSLVVDGGVGIAENLNVGGNLKVNGTQTTFSNTGDITLLLEGDTDNITDTDNPEIWFKQDGGGVFARIGLNNWDGNSTNENQLVISTGGGIVNTNGIIFQAGGRGPNQALNVRPNFSTTDPVEVLRLTPSLNTSSVKLEVSDTTGSTSVSTGALVVDGGAGIAENLNVGGNIDFTGTLDVDGDVNLNSTTGSTSPTTGALVVDGGVGIAENLYVGGDVNFAGTFDLSGDVAINTTDLVITEGSSISFLDGSLTLDSDGQVMSLGFDNVMAFATDNFIIEKTDGTNVIEVDTTGTGEFDIGMTTASTSKTTGSLIVGGGVGIGGDINCDSINQTNPVVQFKHAVIGSDTTLTNETYIRVSTQNGVDLTLPLLSSVFDGYTIIIINPFVSSTNKLLCAGSDTFVSGGVDNINLTKNTAETKTEVVATSSGWEYVNIDLL